MSYNLYPLSDVSVWLSVVGLGTFKFLCLLLSDSDDESKGPRKNVNQLGVLGGICLDNVYMNYLQEKQKNPQKKVEETKPKKGSKNRSVKPSAGPPKNRYGATPRRNSSPKVVGANKSSNSRDDNDLFLAPPKNRGRRGSLQPVSLQTNLLSPRTPSPRGLRKRLPIRGEIQEDEKSDEDSLNSNKPSPAPSLASLKEEDANKADEPDPRVDEVEKEDKTLNEKNEKPPPATSQEDDLLLTLMKKNVKESEFTPEEKALYDAHDIVWAEYKRRKTQRQRIGGLMKARAKQLRGILGKLNRSECQSDLALKARSNDLQKKKREARKHNRRFSSYGGVNDSNKI